MADLADTIRNIPLFSGLTREDIAKVLGKLEEKSFASGTTIISQGDPGDAFYLIESGAVQVVLESAGGRRENIAVLGPQDWFGEMALLSDEPRSATIIAVKDLLVWQLSRQAWEELIEKHPTWLRHFCATLSKRLARADQQYTQGRDAFNSVAEEFYNSRPPEEQEFLRRAALFTPLEPELIGKFFKTGRGEDSLTALINSHLPLIHRVDGDKYDLHPFFRSFLLEKLISTEGQETKQHLHTQLAEMYNAHNSWQQAIRHCTEAQDYAGAARIIADHKDDLLASSPAFLKGALEQIPIDYYLSDLRLVHIKAETLAKTADFVGAIRAYKEVLAHKGAETLGAEAIKRRERMADVLVQQRNYREALNSLRSLLNLVEQAANFSRDVSELERDSESQIERTATPEILAAPAYASVGANLASLFSRVAHRGFSGKWFGGVTGLVIWAYFWFWTPDIGLGPAATKQFGLLCLTLIYWVFAVFPDYGVALMFSLGLILSGLGRAEVVLGGFASKTWFMTLGVLALGAAITSSGLFYRLSLQLVRFFPLNYYWQIVALGIMGIVVMALIPQQSARTAIISQMLVNLSESLGYKNPSVASTGLFVASFLGLGQLGFLFLTGSTTSLIAWGMLPADVRAQFTWGYWFVAALPPTLVVTVIIIACSIFLYRPESKSQVSYKMVQNQLQVLGPLSAKEWITLVVLFFTVTGWLTFGHHGIDGAWISLISLCVLVNTGALGWGMMKKGIDWELLVYMGATLSIPTILTEARLDQWMVGLFSPMIIPFLDTPALSFIVIALITFVVKLLFTSFLTVVTLTIALLPLAADMNMSPWIMAMIVLMASEVWFFKFQVDWHTLAYSTSDGKGFSYAYMSRISFFYPLAYIIALVLAIPYWRYLGLMG